MYRKQTFFLLLIAMVMNACTQAQKNGLDKSGLEGIPTADEVGADRMPDTIAPMTAPFDMPKLEKPIFAKDTLNIRSLGAEEFAVVTPIIQKAIDQLSETGGGTVLVPSGIWNTGRISLKSRVNLHLEKGAELHFSGWIKDYLPVVFTRNEGIELMSLGACIYANGQEQIAITGQGKLVGPPKDSEVRKRIMTKDVIENVVSADAPMDKRVYDGKNGGFIFPIMFIAPIQCKQVYIEGLSLENTAFWNVVPQYCEEVIIRGLKINSVGIPRGDGIDIESCKKVLIEYCTLMTGDDCMAMKAGRGDDGLRVNKPTEQVVVRYCLAEKGHGGITIGSETAGTVRNLYVHDCVFNNEGVGIRFKTRRPRGGGGEKLYYNRLRMNVGKTVVSWDMLGSAMYVGAAADRSHPVEVNRLTPFFRDIEMRNLLVEGGREMVKAEGLPESPLAHVRMQNIQAKTKKLFSFADAKDIEIERSVFQSEDSVLSFLGSHQIRFNQVAFEVPGKNLLVDTADSKEILFEGVNTPLKYGQLSEK